MTPLERLLAIDEIKGLRARWSKLVDELRLQELKSVLADDAVLDISSTATLAGKGLEFPAVHGAQAVCDFLEERLSSEKRQVHIATMPEIHIESDTEARGDWRQESFIPAQSRDGKVGIGFGTCEDTYRKIGGRWLIQTMKVRVDQVL